MIYTDFWSLSFFPFANDNRPATFVPTRGANRALARLRYALGTGMGASALFGEPGSGKSRLARMLALEFEAAHWLTAYLPTPSGGAWDILATLTPGVVRQRSAESTGMTELQAFLLDRSRHNQPVLLIADDVQAARGTDFLETLRALLNIERDGVKALSILLVGQAGMDRKLAAASSFDSQLLTRAVMEPMTEEETRLYILARLKAAGSKQGIFTKHAAELVVRFSHGLPRQVNRLCELSLVVAYGLEEKRVSPEIVEMAAADLDMLPVGEASFFGWPHPPAPQMHTEEVVEQPADGEDVLAALAVEGA